MDWDVKRVEPLSDYRIYVEVADSRRRVFDLKSSLEHGVFQELKDRVYFRRVGIVHGAVT